MIQFRQVPFSKLCYGAKFKYDEAHTALFVKIGHNTVAQWDATQADCAWVAQGLYSAFDSDKDLSRHVWMLDERAEPSAPKCCEPTAEEQALLEAGDYQPEELWGGPRPTCPKCIKIEPSTPADRDEQAAFEAKAPELIGKKFLAMVDLAKDEDGEYKYDPAATLYRGWMARAALERKP